MSRMTLAVWVIAAAALGAIGCESVKSTEPIGQRSEASLESWTGTWRLNDRMVFLKGADDGVLHIAIVVWREDAFELVQLNGFITSLGERQFLNLQEDAPKGEGSDAGWPRYSFMLLERAEEDELVFAGVNVQAFREAVEAGDLVGDVRVDRVVVDEAGNEQPQGTHVLLRDKAAMDAFLARAPLDTLFNREEPLHLRRVTGVKVE